MSECSGSARTRVLQAISLLFAGVAIASGWTTTTAQLVGVDFYTAVASLGVIEIGALFGAHYLCAGLKARRWFVAACAAALAAICIGNAGSNGLNYAWSKHSLQEAHRIDASKRFTTERDAAQAALDRAERALADYDDVRATSDIQDDVDKCEREGCKTVRNKTLAVELDRATKRDTLTVRRDTAKQRRAAVQPVVQQRSAAAAFMQSWVGADPDKVELSLAALYVALVVLAAPLCAGLAQLIAAPAVPAVPAQRSADTDTPGTGDAAQPTALPVSKPTLPAQPATVLHSTAAPAQPRRASVPSVPAQRSKALHAVTGRAEQMLRYVAQRGGELRGTYSEWEKQLGMHQVTIGHAIREAVEAGLMLRESSSRGTVLRLTPAYAG